MPNPDALPFNPLFRLISGRPAEDTHLVPKLDKAGRLLPQDSLSAASDVCRRNVRDYEDTKPGGHRCLIVESRALPYPDTGVSIAQRSSGPRGDRYDP